MLLPMNIDSPRTLTKRDPEANDKTTMGLPGLLSIPIWRTMEWHLQALPWEFNLLGTPLMLKLPFLHTNFSSSSIVYAQFPLSQK